MTIEAARREFVEWMFAEISERWIVHRMFGIGNDVSIDAVRILDRMVELGIVAIDPVDPEDNEFGSPVLPFLVKSQPIEEVKAERRDRVRRAIERIRKDTPGGSPDRAGEK